MKNREFNSEDNLQAYFNRIRRIPLLNFEEEIELSKQIQRGNEVAKQRLIEANLRLVVKIARGYMTNDVSLIDLVQEGNVGLIKAASKFDHKKNVRFSTYAAWWIKQSIARALSNKRRSIRLPHRKEEMLKKIQKTYTVLSQKYLRRPSTEEIAEELNMKPEDVLSILSAANAVVSLETETNEDSGTLMDLCEDSSFDPDKELIEKSMHEETMKFLEHLLDREKKILMYRFSFYGNEKYTLKRIGEELGISPETVRQIEKRAIKKLQEHADELREYVYN